MLRDASELARGGGAASPPRLAAALMSQATDFSGQSVGVDPALPAPTPPPTWGSSLLLPPPTPPSVDQPGKEKVLALKPEDHLEAAVAEAAFLSARVPEVRHRSQTPSVRSGLDLIHVVGRRCAGCRGDGVMFDPPLTRAVDPGPPRRCR